MTVAEALEIVKAGKLTFGDDRDIKACELVKLYKGCGLLRARWGQ